MYWTRDQVVLLSFEPTEDLKWATNTSYMHTSTRHIGLR